MNDFCTAPDGLPATAGSKIQNVCGRDNLPLILTMGIDRNIYLFSQPDGAGKGWRQLNLTAGVGRHPKVRAWDVWQGEDLTTQIGIAVSFGPSSELCTLMLTEPFDPVATDWSQLAYKFVDRPHPEAPQRVGHLSLSSLADSGRAWMLATTVDPVTGLHKRFEVATDLAKKQSLWQEFPFQHDPTDVMDMAVGKCLGRPCCASLYLTGERRVISLTVRPRSFGGEPEHLQLKRVPPGSSCLSFVPGRNRKNWDLYVAGDGVYGFRMNTKGEYDGEVVLNSGQAPGVKALAVERRADDFHVWALDERGRLQTAADTTLDNHDQIFPRTLPRSAPLGRPVPSKLAREPLYEAVASFGIQPLEGGKGPTICTLTKELNDGGETSPPRLTFGSWDPDHWRPSDITMDSVWSSPPLPLSELNEVIKKHGPHLQFDSKEEFFMSSVGHYLKNVGLWDKKGRTWKVPPGALWDSRRKDMDLSEVPEGTKENIKNFWLQIPDSPNDCIIDPALLKAGTRDGKGVVGYVHAKFLPSEDCTDIQFWLFCPFNGAGAAFMWLPTETEERIDLSPLGEHEGDWELVTLRVDNYEMIPRGAYLSQHGASPWFPEEDMDRVNGGRMSVYASRNGHANYPKPGMNLHPEFRADAYRFGLRNDTDRGAYSVDLSQSFELVSAEFLGEEAPREPDWLEFPFQWGRSVVFGKGAVEDVIRENVPKTLDVILTLLPMTFLSGPALFRAIFPNIAYDLIPEHEKKGNGPPGPKQHSEWEGFEGKVS